MSDTPIDPQKAMCPTCGHALTLIDDSVKVGAGPVETSAWSRGYLYECPNGHGRWHLLEGGKHLSRSLG